MSAIYLTGQKSIVKDFIFAKVTKINVAVFSEIDFLHKMLFLFVANF